MGRANAQGSPARPDQGSRPSGRLLLSSGDARDPPDLVEPPVEAHDPRQPPPAHHRDVDRVPGREGGGGHDPPGTLHVGADYRLRSIPLTLGATVNWTPGYTTRLAADQTASVGAKTVVDANALWTFTPSVRLRLSAGNLAAADYGTGGSFETESLRETTETTTRTYVNWQLRLELKM